MIVVCFSLILDFDLRLTTRLVPAGDTKYYKSPFLRDFWHLNIAMMTSNNALIPDPDKEDILASKPLDWPFLHLGLRMCGWGDTQLKYYLVGTPVIWWGGTLSLVVAVVSWGVYVLRWQRKYVDMSEREWEHFMYVRKVAFFGWFFHFGEFGDWGFSLRRWLNSFYFIFVVPFLVMGRVTYIHHYVRPSLPSPSLPTPTNLPFTTQLPTLYFSVLMLSHVLDHFIFSARTLSERTKAIVFGVVAFMIVGSFWWFRGVAFGIEGPVKEHWGLGWRKVCFFPFLRFFLMW